MKICINCGKEHDDNAKFCTGCGNKMPEIATEVISEKTEVIPDYIIPAVPVDLNSQIKREKPKSRKGPIIAVIFTIIVLLAVAAVVIGNLYFDLDFFPFNILSKKPLTAQELLDLGEKYLLDMNYEQSIVYFEKLIEIEPKNPRGYTGAAEAYIALDKVDEAVKILEKGLKVLPGNPELTAMLNKLSKSEPVIVDDTSWKQILKNFLISDFPSLFDETTKKKNKELFDKYYDDNNYIPATSDIPVDAYGGWHNDWYYYPLLLPSYYTFYDLDNDGIPEMFVGYPTEYAEGYYNFVYKLYKDTYKQIDTGEHLNGGYLEGDILYKDSQNKIVVVYDSVDGIQGIFYADIIGEKIIYSDYIDSKGSKTYNGVKYDSLYQLYEINLTVEQIDPTLTLLPEFDCSDVIDSIKKDMQVLDKPITTEVINERGNTVGNIVNGGLFARIST